MPRRNTPPQSDTPVEDLWNLSTVTAAWLNQEGIITYQHLKNAKLVDLWNKLRTKYPHVTRLTYYALWGAVHNCHWNQIPEKEKQRLR
ncbi:hypothetical protein HGA91_06155 [candidate division WWE3 bacterium]|nr:hypothetical protein [candidate division WWE3 bacterium]